MKTHEMLKVTSDDIALVIVQDMLFIGENDDNADDPGDYIQWTEEGLDFNGRVITPAMVEIVKLYLNKQI